MEGALLSGLRVVEVSAFVAAPLAGATLASLGAEVIRVEQRGGGVDARRWPLHDGRSLFRAGLDRGKRSVTLDLRSPRGQAIVAELVSAPGDDSGILVTNLDASGWMAYEQLAARRPDLIMVVIAGTPDGRTAVDYTVNAGLGFPWITGPEGSPGPVNHVLPAWDVATGLLAATGILAAERHRRRTGEGQLVELALSDVGLTIAGHLGLLAEAALTSEPRGRFGNDLFGSYGRDFRTRDEHAIMVLALTPRQWRALGRATGLEPAFGLVEAAHGVDLSDDGARFVHRAEISTLIERWVGAHDLDEVCARFDEHGVLWGLYRTFKELLRDEPRATDPPASALRFSSHAAPVTRSPERIGADTDRVLGELLGLSPAALDELRASGTID
jgi:2-methylfumaryl-CoA isomerase